MPKCPRALTYLPFSADLCVAGSAPEVWRLNLSEGRFYEPLGTRASAINCCTSAPHLGLLAVGGEDGGVECFDMRAKKPVGYLDAAAALGTVGAAQRRHGALRHGSCHAVGCAVAAGVRMLLATFWCCCGVVAMLLTEVADNTGQRCFGRTAAAAMLLCCLVSSCQRLVAQALWHQL